MTTEEKISILKGYFLFQDLSNQELEEIAQHAQKKVFSAKTIIIHQDKPTVEVFIIYKGLVKSYVITEDGKIVPMKAIPPMEIVGEIEVIADHPTLNVETIQETHFLTFTKEYFRTLLQKPSITLHLLEIVAKKLRNANKREEKHISFSLKERVWEILTILAIHFPNREISLTQEELAALAGGTRARVTEILNEFEDQQKISLAHKKIVVL